MLEVEEKVPLAHGAWVALRDRLLAMGAIPSPAEPQDDLYFSHPCRELARSDEALRLRSGGFGIELTYKGPRQAGIGKVRREQTIRVGGSWQDAVGLLEGLGFLPAARVRKRRETWRLGSLTVALDAVEGLGEFAEVEAMSRDAASARADVAGLMARLGLEGGITSSYLELLGQQAHAAGAAGRRLDD